MLRWLPIVVGVALFIYSLIDCMQSDERAIRTLPRWAWVALIVVFPIAGPIGWLIAGRPTPDSRFTPITGAPDDDPAFLAKLREDAERRRREQWRRERDQGSD